MPAVLRLTRATATQNSPFLPGGGRTIASTNYTDPRRDGQAERPENTGML